MQAVMLISQINNDPQVTSLVSCPINHSLNSITVLKFISFSILFILFFKIYY